ncbi:MAG: ADP-ribosylglycohydrolase family protein [Geminicoccaceae bacterium]
MQDRAPERDLDRATAALFGLALGDAMGMPTQTLDRATIRARYGRITGFVDPFDGHPVSQGLVAGQVTDDTEQTILLARGLIAAPTTFDQAGWAEDLLSWEREVWRRGLSDLLGPSTKRALTALLDGIPAAESGREGTTNGAAMRILPVGIAKPADRLEELIDSVEAVCQVTHNTGEAIAGAAAVAAVVSQGVAGATFEDALSQALRVARMGQGRGHQVGTHDMADRIERALALAEIGDPDIIAEKVGTSVASRESVPAAFAINRIADGDPWGSALIAANIGDDTDTIGAIAAGMAAACRGMGSLPADAVAHLQSVNTLPMEDLASDLLTIRYGKAAAMCREDALS